MRNWAMSVAICSAMIGASPLVGDQLEARQSTADSAAVAQVVNRYHELLAAGDSTEALALLHDDAVVVESGNIETRDEYRAHHLPADMGFVRAVTRRTGNIRVVVQGDVAWATSISQAQGEFRGRQINSTSAELMVLSQEDGEWKIRAIHWSSRRRPRQ